MTKQKRAKPTQKKSKDTLHVSRKKKKESDLLKDLLLAGMISAIISAFLFFSFFTIKKVNGYSMMPTLKPNERIMIARWQNIQLFDLVYLKRKAGKPNQIRRVVGRPGDTIQYKDDSLILNEEVIAEPFIAEERELAQSIQKPYTSDFTLYEMTNESVIPENKFFVLGDNRSETTDSRDYGLIDSSKIIGVVTMKF